MVGLLLASFGSVCCSSFDAGADVGGAKFLPLLPVWTSVPGTDALRFGVTVALVLDRSCCCWQLEV